MYIYDGRKMASIIMTDKETNVDFTADFFDGLRLIPGTQVYSVQDVDYCIDYAESYANGVNPDLAGGNCVVDAQEIDADGGFTLLAGTEVVMTGDARSEH